MAVQGKVRAMVPGPYITDRSIELVFTGNYVTGGDIINLTTTGTLPLLNPDGINGALSFSRAPKVCYVMADSGGGYIEFIKGAGSLATTYKIRCFAAAGTEVPAAAYPAIFSAPTTPFFVGMQHTTVV